MWLGQTSNNGKDMHVYNNTIVSNQNDIGITLTISGHAVIENNIVTGVNVGIHDYHTLTSTVSNQRSQRLANGSGGAPQMASNDSTFLSYSTWQGDGFDANSSTANPNLNGELCSGSHIQRNRPCANLTSLGIAPWIGQNGERPSIIRSLGCGCIAVRDYQQWRRPTISSFTASPSGINPGGSSTLTWSVSGATSLSISGVGTVTGSSTAVSPTSTTTYTLTATNSSGQAPLGSR